MSMILDPYNLWFNVDKYVITIVAVWIWIYSLTREYWEPKMSEDIANSLGEFLKVVKYTKTMGCTSYDRIYVYMDISKELM